MGAMPKQITEIRQCLQISRRKDARSVNIKKNPSDTKFKIRCSRYLHFNRSWVDLLLYHQMLNIFFPGHGLSTFVPLAPNGAAPRVMRSSEFRVPSSEFVMSDKAKAEKL